MAHTRREFIRSVGITLASLAMVRCTPAGDSTPSINITPTDDTGGDSTSPIEITPTDDTVVHSTPTASSGKTPRDRLRICWMQLDWLAKEAQSGDFEQSEQAKDLLIISHQVALNEMTADGQLDADVAGQVRIAFDEAAFHAWRNNAPITCYIALPVEYGARGDLLQQANLLDEAAGHLDPAVVEEVRAAIAQDLALFEAADAEEPPDYNELTEQFEAAELEASPEAIEAARFLIELLLEKTT